MFSFKVIWLILLGSLLLTICDIMIGEQDTPWWLDLLCSFLYYRMVMLPELHKEEKT